MRKDSSVQVFSVIILIVLVLTFYMLMAADTVMGTGSLIFSESLFLIIIAIILLAIYSEVNKIESHLSKIAKKRK